MKNLLLLNLIIQRLKSSLKPTHLFIRNFSYFLTHMSEFKRGVYIINPRVIMQKEYISHEHFRKTTLDLYPRVNIYNVCGSKNSSVSMVGFHPDLRYTIDFLKRKVIKSFYIDVNLEEYCKKRSKMSKHIAAPRYKLIDKKKYYEELIIGDPFNLSSDNYYKFINLLDSYKVFLRTSLHVCIATSATKKELNRITTAVSENIKFDPVLFVNLMSTNYICLSKGSDIAGPNIIESDVGLVLIDWEPRELKYRRFWIDVINLIIKCDPIGFMLGKHDIYLTEIFLAHGISDVEFKKIETKNTIIFASLLANLNHIDNVDLVEDYDHLPCGGLTHVNILDIQKICRSTKRFVTAYKT